MPRPAAHSSIALSAAKNQRKPIVRPFTKGLADDWPPPGLLKEIAKTGPSDISAMARIGSDPTRLVRVVKQVIGRQPYGLIHHLDERGGVSVVVHGRG